MFVLLVSLLGCPADPLQHPDFRPPTDGDVRIELRAPENARVGGPIDVVASVTTLPDSPGEVLDIHGNTLLGRGGDDVWTVRLTGGWSDPSPWWQDSSPRRMTPDPKRVAPEAPVEWTIPLDEWVRFDQPGTYALQLETSRSGQSVVRSNKVAIRVAPRDPAADTARADELLSALETATGGERASLFIELATVGSDATWRRALDKLAEGSDDESGWVLVLAMHPLAEAVQGGITKALAAPEVPVGLGHLRAFEAVAYDAEFREANGRQPSLMDLPALEAHRARLAERTAFRDAARGRAWEAAWKALDQKTPEARGRTLGTLGLAAIRHEIAGEEALWPVLRRDLAQVPDRTVVELLGRYWDDVRDPSVVPALIALVGAPATGEEARSIALQRLAKLDPVAGHEVIEALVADPRRKVADSDLALRSLPSVSDATQAAIVAGLATAADRTQQARLLAWYVSADHMAAVEAAWAAEPADVPTEVVAGYAAYFQNHAPAKAKPLLARWDADHYMLIEWVGELVRDPGALNPLALKGLTSPHQPIFFKSSDYLIEHATPDLLPELLARVPRTEDEHQQALFGVLCANRNWLLDAKTKHALSQAVTDRRSDMILTSTLGSEPPNILVEAGLREGEPILTMNYREYVGAAAITKKLKQFRVGQEIRFMWKGATPDEGEAVFGPIVAEAGLRLFRPSE
ncbi:MAG: hypothetical protein H6737_03460 [Alphaproteobacteria bacterium]|nr:hypothetical protein [Alphaproteobacteria bacterium]